MKISPPCTFRAFKATKNTQCKEYVSWLVFRLHQRPLPFYMNPNNAISTTTKPSYHRVLATALIII